MLDRTEPLGDRPLLTRRELRSALGRRRFADRPSVRGSTSPLGCSQRPSIALAGGSCSSSARRARTARGPAHRTARRGPDRAAARNRRGISARRRRAASGRRMRQRAARISADQPGERLPVPGTGDELQRLGETLNTMLARLEAALERERGFVAEPATNCGRRWPCCEPHSTSRRKTPIPRMSLREAVRTAGDETDRVVELEGDLLLIAAPTTSSRAAPRSLAGARSPGQRAPALCVARGGRRPSARRGRCAAGLFVAGDRLRLEQALGNLVDNALRYGQGTVRIEAQATDSRVEIHVQDQGPGFPATSSRAPFTASAAEMPATRAAARDSASRSSRPWHALTKGRQRRERTARRGSTYPSLFPYGHELPSAGRLA